jgi:hypothetical protein
MNSALAEVVMKIVEVLPVRLRTQPTTGDRVVASW